MYLTAHVRHSFINLCFVRRLYVHLSEKILLPSVEVLKPSVFLITTTTIFLEKSVKVYLYVLD